MASVFFCFGDIRSIARYQNSAQRINTIADIYINYDNKRQKEMSEPERRKCGMIRISMHNIIKLLYGDNSGYKALSMKISKIDRTMIELTISHPALPSWKPGTKMPRIEIKRTYLENNDA
jgi:hypothetical protein